VPDTLVVGGGIAGLVAARELARAGHRVTVCEAGNSWGGQLSQHSVAGIVLDAGAESFATRGGVVATLIDELGLSDDVVSPTGGSAWLYSGERGARRLPASSLFGIPSNPLARDVVASVGLLSALRASVDLLMGSHWRVTAPDEHLTLGALVRGRMGNTLLERLVAPIVEGVYSKHPDDLAVSTISPGLLAAIAEHGSLSRAVDTLRATAPAGSLVAGLAGGMHRIVDALLIELTTLGVSLELNARVSAVTPHSVQVNGATREGLVVLATPGLVVSGSAAPVTTTPVTLVTLVLEHPELSRDPRGSGVIVQRGAADGPTTIPAGITARALTHSTAKWAWLREQVSPHEIVRLSYRPVSVAAAATAPATTAAAAAAPATIASAAAAPPTTASAATSGSPVTSEADLIDQARRDASAILGITITPNQVSAAKVVHWARAERQAPPEGFVCVGDWVAGTGLASVIAQARTVNELLTATVSAKGSA
jgi:oxygen-dependent protoporphyrinogen oxidase